MHAWPGEAGRAGRKQEPEPASLALVGLALVGLALAGLAGAARRKPR